MTEQPKQQSQQNVNISDINQGSVQIGGNAGGNLEVTQIQNANIYSTFQFPPASFSESRPLSRQEYRRREVLLSKVQRFWIKGFLEKSLHKQVVIELGLEERSVYVPNPLDKIEEFPEDPRQCFPAGTKAADIFDDIGAGRTLLILGEPGAGKTVTLLKLAESLIARTSEDLSQPVPVVVNLSSWSRKQKPFDVWLNQELRSIYDISQSQVKEWIDEEQLILLLDGLDEVEAKYRDACVQALNLFIHTHNCTEIVVCSRIRDYEDLSEKLSLRSAIYVKPLTPQQVDDYLRQAGESLATLRSIISQNSDIKALASSPLILSIMSLAYQDSSLNDFPQSSTSEAFRSSLFDTYIKRMFQRRKANNIYSEKKVKYWLIWLAQRMHRNSESIFLIENLQPFWFQNEFDKDSYYVYYFLILLLIIGLIAWLIYLMAPKLIIGWISWSFSLLISVWNSELSFHRKRQIFILVSLITFAPVAAFISWVKTISLEEIKMVETINWSWKSAKDSFHAAKSFRVIYEQIAKENIKSTSIFFTPLGSDLLISDFFSPFFGCFFGLVGGLFGGFKGPAIQEKSEPNQGIWKSAQNASILGLIGGLISGLFYGLIVWLLRYISFELINAFIFGLIGWLISGLICGGSACIQHFSLRFTLRNGGYIPWNYARFLEYAAERLFLQKVGGGYVFIHRMLLEHFAQMELEPLQNNSLEMEEAPEQR